MATRVAERMGLTVEEVLAEAETLLKESTDAQHSLDPRLANEDLLTLAGMQCSGAETAAPDPQYS